MNIVSAQSHSIAIVGGGVSGVLTVIHLLRMARAPLTIHLVEERSAPGLGVAYSTSFDEHLLNVPAAGMSLFADQPLHFLEWLQQHRPGEFGPDDFVPRKIFGTYVRSVFEQTLRQPRPLVSLQIHAASATAIHPEQGEVRVHLSHGGQIRSSQVVLALGNYPPADPVVAGPDWEKRGWYFSNPWNEQLYAGAASLKDILLIGSGLTAIDVVVAFEKLGFTGHYHLVSTHGLLPRAHQPFGTHSLSFDVSGLPGQLDTRQLYQLFRRELALAKSDWRAVVQAFRPITIALWRKLPIVEQRKFLRRLAPWWNVHRHRIAPAIARRIAGLREEGRLRVWKGRVAELQPGVDGLIARITTKKAAATPSLSVGRVINCTGPQSSYTRIAEYAPFIHQLIRQGLLRPDALQSGIDALPDGRLVQADGTPSPYLFTLGTPMKGILLECTSVPEIREQAEQLAIDLLQTARATPPLFGKNEFSGKTERP